MQVGLKSIDQHGRTVWHLRDHMVSQDWRAGDHRAVVTAPKAPIGCPSVFDLVKIPEQWFDGGTLHVVGVTYGSMPTNCCRDRWIVRVRLARDIDGGPLNKLPHLFTDWALEESRLQVTCFAADLGPQESEAWQLLRQDIRQMVDLAYELPTYCSYDDLQVDERKDIEEEARRRAVITTAKPVGWERMLMHGVRYGHAMASGYGRRYPILPEIPMEDEL